MKSLTLRGIDQDLEQRLKNRAKNESKSLNQLILDILQTSFGLKKEKKFTKKYHDLDHLFGRWTGKEFDSIENKINKERKIDKELWD